MPHDLIQLTQFDGVSTLTASEDLSVEVLQELINLRPLVKVGRAVKRNGYADLSLGTITDLKVLAEFKDGNGDIYLLVVDGNTLKTSTYTSSYASLVTVSNDERTSGSTISGSDVLPLVAREAIRAPAGQSASTQRPFLLQYIPARDRYNSAVSLTAGLYLTDQMCEGSSGGLFHNPAAQNAGDGDVYVTAGVGQATGLGLTEAYYTGYISYVLDGYQRCFPEPLGTVRVGSVSNNGALHLIFSVKVADASLMKRITAVDFFVSKSTDRRLASELTEPAYFVERINLNDDSEPFFDAVATLDNAASTAVIADYPDWLTFDPTGIFLYNLEDDEYYRITSVNAYDSPTTGDVTLNITPAPTTGTRTVQFLSRWYNATLWSENSYIFRTFYDDHFKKQGALMEDYLGIPIGDRGLDERRYKFAAFNGNRALYSNYPEDTNISYFTPVDAPDVVPALNVVIHQHPVVGSVAVGRDFLVFTDKSIERIRIYSSADAVQEHNFVDAILANPRSIVKINDDTVMFMTKRNGPYLYRNGRLEAVGIHLREWWQEKLSDSQMAGCVAGYNYENNEVWFSFPDYATTPFSTGMIAVFDLNGHDSGYKSPWWFVKTDTAIKAMETNHQGDLLAAGATKVVSMDNSAGTETVDTLYKTKMLQNGIPNRGVRWRKLYIDSITSDTVTAKIYRDGSASADTITLNSDLTAFLRYISDTLELEISTTASTNSVEHKGMVFTFNRKKTT